MKWSEEIFWNATHRKIDAILKIDREVNEGKKKKRNIPAHAPGTEKITVEEALKRF